MRSETCVPESRLVLPLLLVAALFLLTACAEKAHAPKPERDFGAEIQGLGMRLITILDQRKVVRDTPFFANTSVTEEMKQMSIRIDACTESLRRLAQYDIDADAQGLSDAERFDHRDRDLQALDQHFSHYEKVFARYDELRLKDAEVFFDNYGKTLHGNQVLQVLIENGVPTYEEQNLMRDISQRVLDSRRYWCQELANVLRGLEPDPDLLALSVGQARNLVAELDPIHNRLNLAFSDYSRLTNGRNGIAQRMAWSRETLERQTADEDFRARSLAALDVLASEVLELERRVTEELQQLLDQSHPANERREAIVRAQTELLDRINRVVLVEAQKRGWPLPH